jgi:hypothetical protein
MKNKLFVLFFLFILPHRELSAWGKQGHQIVALIAKSQVTEEAVGMIDFYLKGLTWEDAAVWLDEETKTGPSQMKNWHRALVPKDKTYVPVKTPDLINQLEFNLRVLENRSLFQVKDISKALKILMHLIADLHQPLNCGYTEDDGGRNMPVNFEGKKTNLADVWNDGLIALNKTDLWDCTKILMDLPQKEKKSIEVLNFTAWMEDSRKLLPEVYAFTGDTIDEKYAAKNKILIETQLVKAGLRLAALLNKMFRD